MTLEPVGIMYYEVTKCYQRIKNRGYHAGYGSHRRRKQTVEAVKVENVGKIYTNSNNVSVNALKNVNISIQKGEFVAIVGPSGSGKSTLLHLLGGLESFNEGKIEINGMNIAELSENEMTEFRRKYIGFVFQKFNLIPMLNVKENIELPLLLGNDYVDDKYINELIDFLGLSDRIMHMPAELSGGQQQRVSLGRALVTKPSVLLADEPTGNLDQQTSRTIMDYLKQLQKKYKQTIIMITHDIELAKQADRLIQIVDGRVLPFTPWRAPRCTSPGQ